MMMIMMMMIVHPNGIEAGRSHQAQLQNSLCCPQQIKIYYLLSDNNNNSVADDADYTLTSFILFSKNFNLCDL